MKTLVFLIKFFPIASMTAIWIMLYLSKHLQKFHTSQFIALSILTVFSILIVFIPNLNYDNKDEDDIN